MDVNELKEILQVLDERHIAEFELEKEGMKLRIRRAEASNHAQPPMPESTPARAPEPGRVAPPTPAAAPPVEEQEQPGITIVRSPIVGTFYRAASPETPAFTDVGQRVAVGQVLCVIEAMKLMNEIEAEAAGEVVCVHVENGRPVQYGEALFSIRTAA